MGIRDIALKVGKADASGSGNFFKPGKGVAVVKKVLFKADGHNGDSFIIETEVLSAIPTARDAEGKLIPCNEPGSSASFVQTFAGKQTKVDMAHKNSKMAILALTDAEEAAELDHDAEKLANTMELLCTEGNPARGVKVAFETVEGKKPESKGKHFVQFSRIVQTDEEIAASRARLDGKDPLKAL